MNIRKRLRKIAANTAVKVTLLGGKRGWHGYALVSDISMDGKIILLTIPVGDSFWNRLYQERGVFLSTKGEEQLQLFLDHNGTWTCTFNMRQYTIVPAQP